MTQLAVIGNISRDITRYPDGARRVLIGGAALHVARAAARAGLPATAVAVIGQDLASIRADPRLAGIDLSAVSMQPGRSAEFTLSYDQSGHLVHVDARYQVAVGLSAHALAWSGSHTAAGFHVCCRLPLDVGAILEELTLRGHPFTADFHSPSAAETIPRAAPFLRRSRAVFVNAAEAETLAAHVPAHHLRALVITDGPRPVSLFRHGRLAVRSRPPAASPAEVTGAGDTLTGTLLAGWAAGHADQSALDAAVAAATAHTTAPPLFFQP